MPRFNLRRPVATLFISLVLMGVFAFFANSHIVANTIDSSQVSVTLGRNYEQIIDRTNPNPPDEIVLPGGNQIELSEGDSFTITGSKFDQDGDDLFYYWEANGGSFTTTDPIRFTEVSWQAPSVNIDTQFYVRALAGDGRGLISRSYFYITVKNRLGDNPSIGGGDPGTVDGDGFAAINWKADINNFPLVKLSFDLKENGETVDDLYVRNFTVRENGRMNHSPMVALPPKPANNQIDLFILIDRSGNAKKYEAQILTNVKALVRYMRSQGVDLKVYLDTFNNQDRDGSINFNSFLGTDNAFDSTIDNLNFDEGRLDRAHALAKLFYFTNLSDQSGRENAEKIAVIMNGSQFHRNEEDTSIQNSLNEVMLKMLEHDFTVFVVGHPMKQIYALGSNKTGISSLSQSLPGGYLGSFNTDLTQIYDWLKERDADTYTFLYYSFYKTYRAAIFQPVQFYGLDKASELFGFDYRGIDLNTPIINTLPLRIDHPDFIEVEVDIDHGGTFINAVEMSYHGTDRAYHTIPMEHRREFSTADTFRYGVSLPRSEIYDDFSFSVKVYTPFDVIDSSSAQVDTTAINFDDGITLTPTLANESGQEKVVWKWSGPTVNEGSGFELWGGDQLIAEIKNSSTRSYSIDVEDCNRYQVVKLRVKLPSTANHPKAGGFSDFSREAEVFLGENNTLTEKQVIDLALQCVQNKQLMDLASVTNLEPGAYKENETIYLNKALAYITAVRSLDLYNKTWTTHFTKLYWNLRYITDDEFDQYWDGSQKPAQSIFYEVITRMNQSNNFEEDYEWAADLTRGQRDGGSTI